MLITPSIKEHQLDINQLIHQVGTNHVPLNDVPLTSKLMRLLIFQWCASHFQTRAVVLLKKILLKVVSPTSRFMQLLSSNGAPLTRLMEVVLLKKSSLRLHLLRSDSCVCSPQVVRLPPQDSYGCSPQMVRLSPLYLLNRRVNGW